MRQVEKYLIVYLTICLIGLGAIFWVSQWPSENWMYAYSGTHKIAFNISRSEDTIAIQYLGGKDSQFIDHLKIEVEDRMGPRTSYHWKPRLGRFVYIPLVEYPANVTVYGYAIDTRTYWQLSHATGI